MHISTKPAVKVYTLLFNC